MRPTGPFFATPVGRRATSAGGHFCETKPISDAADCLARRLSLCGLRPRAFAEAHSGATAVYFDEFHAGQLKGPSKRRKGRMTRFRCFTFNRVPKDLSPNGSSECCLLAQNRHGLSKFAISPFPPSPSPRSSPHNKRRELLPAAPCDRFQTKSLRGGGSPRCVIPAADRRAWCRVRASRQ